MITVFEKASASRNVAVSCCFLQTQSHYSKLKLACTFVNTTDCTYLCIFVCPPMYNRIDRGLLRTTIVRVGSLKIVSYFVYAMATAFFPVCDGVLLREVGQNGSFSQFFPSLRPKTLCSWSSSSLQPEVFQIFRRGVLFVFTNPLPTLR